MTYIEALAHSIYQEVHPDSDLPDAERPLYLIYGVLALAVGENVTAEHVHDAWSAWKASANPSHPSVKPFAQLSREIQAEDAPYVDAIRKVARGFIRSAS